MSKLFYYVGASMAVVNIDGSKLWETI